MIEAPFRADDGAARRLVHLEATVGPEVVAAVEAIALASVAPDADPLAASTLPAAEVARLVARFGLASERELALLALPVAGALSDPPISGYRVAAAGIEADAGDLVLGANLEFRGADLTSTVHAEGFVSLRVRRRGGTLETLAVREAHPCAHCRQTLTEAASAGELEIIDIAGHELTLADLYPWPFQPAALGMDGDRSASTGWAHLAFTGAAPPAAVASLLLEAGSRAHAPYSRSPSAVVLQLEDGRLVAAGCVESVAFNPTITALQAALVEVAAARSAAGGIAAGWLARAVDGPVDPAPAYRALLGAVAPSAAADVVDWQTG